tara:strand:+ start:199 stop:1503 length:1305 start_codon:yes stop_codon:yes gene_type:complete
VIKTPRIAMLATVALLGFATPLKAVEVEAEVRASVGKSDNISRVPNNEIDETIVSTGFDFALTENTRRMMLDLQSNIEYVDYQDGSFDSEWIGGLRGEAAFTLIDERLRWNIMDIYGQQLFDPLQPEVPQNREDVNFFTTGPTITFVPSVRTPVDLDLAFTRVNFERRPQDHDRLSAALSIGRALRRESMLSLNLSNQRIVFDEDTIFSPVELYEAFIRYEVTGARNEVSVDLGYTEVEQSGFEGDGVLIRLSWVRRVSANGVLSLTAGSQYSNQGDIFQFYGDLSTDLTSTVDGSTGASPFQNRSLTAGYVLETDRTLFELTADWVNEDYEAGLGADRDLYRGDARIRRDLSRTVYVEGGVGFSRREFPGANREDDDTILGVGVGFRLTPGFSISLEHRQFRRDSSTPAADFTENRTFLSFAYVPKWGRGQGQ